MEDQLKAIRENLDKRDVRKAEVLIARLLRRDLNSQQRAQVLFHRARARLLSARPDEAIDDLQVVRSAERVPVANADVYLEVRGDDARAPVLLWLHGGRGGAERPLFRYFHGELERRFVVAYWDQRGAGRSFDADADPRALLPPGHSR